MTYRNIPRIEYIRLLSEIEYSLEIPQFQVALLMANKISLLICSADHMRNISIRWFQINLFVKEVGGQLIVDISMPKRRITTCWNTPHSIIFQIFKNGCDMTVVVEPLCNWIMMMMMMFKNGWNSVVHARNVVFGDPSIYSANWMTSKNLERWLLVIFWVVSFKFKAMLDTSFPYWIVFVCGPLLVWAPLQIQVLPFKG